VSKNTPEVSEKQKHNKGHSSLSNSDTLLSISFAKQNEQACRLTDLARRVPTLHTVDLTTLVKSIKPIPRNGRPKMAQIEANPLLMEDTQSIHVLPND
jgi:hypothetical protein